MASSSAQHYSCPSFSSSLPWRASSTFQLVLSGCYLHSAPSSAGPARPFPVPRQQKASVYLTWNPRDASTQTVPPSTREASSPCSARSGRRSHQQARRQQLLLPLLQRQQQSGWQTTTTSSQADGEIDFDHVLGHIRVCMCSPWCTANGTETGYFLCRCICRPCTLLLACACNAPPEQVSSVHKSITIVVEVLVL